MPTQSTVPPSPVWSPLGREAVQVVAGLRSARVSLLSGPPRCGKSALLLQGVLPLLRRRAADRGVAPTEVGRALPFPDRRRLSGALWAASAETVIYLDGWSYDPLPGLIGRIQVALGLPRVVDRLDDAALADSLTAWGRQLGTRLLVILDQFEQVLALDDGCDAAVRLHRALRHAVLVPTLPANFLFVLRADANSGLAAWRRELPGFDRRHVRLDPESLPASQRYAEI